MGNPNQTPDATIIGFKTNDSRAMHATYLAVFPKVRAHVLKNSGDEDQAKDIFQEAFVACWKNIKDGKFSDGNIEAYLFTIARNKWTDFLRSPNFRKTMTIDAAPPLRVVPDTEEGMETEEEARHMAIRSGLAQLGDNCKTLLKLFYYERKSMEEIAGEMGLAPASARNQKYRCMERLRALSHKIKEDGY